MNQIYHHIKCSVSVSEKLCWKAKQMESKTEKSYVPYRENSKYNFICLSNSYSLDQHFSFLFSVVLYSLSVAQWQFTITRMRITANEIAYSPYNIFGAELSYSISFDVVIATASYVVELSFFFLTCLCSQEMSILFRQRIKMDMAKIRPNWIYFISQTYLR